MQKILNRYKKEIKKYAEENIDGLIIREEIRTNISAVFLCNYLDNCCIFKYVLSGSDELDENDSEYFKIHAREMLKLSKCKSFPTIHENKYFKIEGNEFILIVEELLVYDFAKGVLATYNLKKHDVIETCKVFLLQLLNLYIEAEKYDFVSHRDLSFDNLMYNKNSELKMIDLGSAKTEYSNTTVFGIPAPTKKFYSAPEYDLIHREEKNKDKLIKAEIYTIGLLCFSLLNSLDKGLLYKEVSEHCGIKYWIEENKVNQGFGDILTEKNKKDYMNYILINIFEGNDENVLYRLLSRMVNRSYTVRFPSYKSIYDYLKGK